jgi:hypothetical protein
VRLRRKVDDRLDLLVPNDALDEIAVGDVPLDEDDPAVDVVQARSVTGVGKEVVGDDVVARMVVEPVADEVRADEPGRAGDEEAHVGED